MTKKIIVLASILLILVPSTAGALSQEQLNTYNSGINFFDTDTGTGNSSCSSASTLSGSTNGIRAYNYFIGKGLTPQAAAGIVGNMTEESIGVEPERLQNDYTGLHPAETLTDFQLNGGANGRDIGWGTVQFTPPSKYITVSKDNGASYPQINSLSYQLDFVWGQLDSQIISDLKSAATPEAAADVWLKDYEKGNPSPTREAYARAYYNLATQNTPLPASVPVSSTDAGGSDAGGGVVSGCGGSVEGYSNPFRNVPDIADAGLDAGADYSGEGDVYALGNGTVVYASDSSGWVGGHAIAYKLTDGPAQGKTVYVAENCPVNNSLRKGSSVTSDTVVCHMNNAYPYIETGWAADGTDQPQAYIDKCYYITNPSIAYKTTTNYGINFNQLLVRLGAPKGSLLSPPVTCALPSGWPQW
jgi:hypothetical protein